MAVFNNPFDSYQLYFYSGSAAAYPVVIQVYQAGLLVGRIAFVPDGTPVPANTVITPLGAQIPAIYYSYNRLGPIVGMLRYDKPLFVFLDTSSGVGMVATSQNEPVGEQEGV